MSTGLSTQNSRLSKFGSFEPSSSSASSTSYNVTNGFNNSKSNWSGSIWSNGGLSRPLTDAQNEGSRFKGTAGISVDTNFEGKTGSGSLLASSEYDGWDRAQSVPWHTSNANSSSNTSSKSISPVRHRITDPPNTRQTSQSNGRSASPFFKLGTNLDSQDDVVSFQKQLSPNVDGFSQRIPETSPFSGFSARSTAQSESRRENNMAGFTTTSTQHMPSLSRSISHGDGQASINGMSLVTDESLSHTKTLSSMNARLPPSSITMSLPHSNNSSISAPSRRATHSTQPSFHSLAYDSLNRVGGDDIDFTPAFGRLNLQHLDNQAYTASLDSPSRFDALNPHESVSARQRQTYSPAPTLSNSAAQNLPNRYYGQPPFTRNSSAPINGFVTPNPAEGRKHVPQPAFSSSSTPPSGHDLGNAGSNFSSQGPNMPVAALDRRLRGLQPLQQEPANYGPGQQNQQTHHQSRLQYPSNYEYGPYSVRVNHVGNPYTMSPYVNFVQPQMGPRFSARDNDPMRSALLEEFRTNNKTNKRFELKDIYGHVVEFAGDQHGSRFIQQKLETANSDEKDQVFNEIQSNSLQLMTDLFGNYVIQKLFEHGNQPQKKILANQMKGHVLSLSNQMYGCRVVQKALEHILTDQQATLINELNGKGLVLQCVRDQNGNHVIQKAIERVPSEHIHFIIEAFLGQVGQLATHAYGCRVIQRMLEHCHEPSRRDILEEIHSCVPTLIIDQFGNYVIQHVIEHGDEGDRASIVSIVISNVLNYSKHKFASNVVEKSIEFGAPLQRAEILRLLTCPNERGESPVLGLVRDQYGNYVIQKVLTILKSPDRENLIYQIKPHIASLKKISCGKQIIAIEKIILDADFEATQSSQSSSLPSTNASTVDGPVTPGQSVGLASPPGSISGSADGSLIKTPTAPTMVAENNY